MVINFFISGILSSRKGGSKGETRQAHPDLPVDHGTDLCSPHIPPPKTPGLKGKHIPGTPLNDDSSRIILSLLRRS